MRREKRAQQKRAKAQNKIENLRQQIAANEAETVALEAKIAANDAMIAIIDSFSDRLNICDDILQKKTDGIQLQPHEEAIYKHMTTTFLMHAHKA